MSVQKLALQSKRYLFGRHISRFNALLIVVLIVIASSVLLLVARQQMAGLETKLESDQQQLAKTQLELVTAQTELEQLKQVDQFQKNQELETEISNLQSTFAKTVTGYEAFLRLKEDSVSTQTFESLFAATLTLLGQRNYASASAQLAALNAAVQKRSQELSTAAATATLTAPAITEAPNSGYRRQSVTTELGAFVVDIVAADLNTTRVQVETASGGDCRDNCPVASLSDFVTRSGGFAGINGPYFCPAEYPSCAGKTNSFDTLIMNKSKVYFNSENNVYSSVPAVIFSGNSARFVGATQEWGRDTGVDAVIAAQPRLLAGGAITFGGDGDPKKGSRGNRSFIGAKGSTVYIGVVRGATVAEVAYVLKAMGLENALNLDSGGSTALMSNGRYLAGPGRQTPFGIVFVRK